MTYCKCGHPIECHGVAGCQIEVGDKKPNLNGYCTCMEEYGRVNCDTEMAHKLSQEIEMGLQEVCICAAVQLSNGELFRGQRHSDAMQCAWTINPDLYITQEMQGFITSRNRFVSREEGAQLQNTAGVVSVKTGKPTEGQLFSEDLY